MNEHLPPPRRSIPAQEHSAMRERLRSEMGGQSRQARSRLFAPALAAAATMAVVAVGGYVSLGGGSESPRTGFASDVTATTPPPEDECDIEMPPEEAGPEPDLSGVTVDHATVPPPGADQENDLSEEDLAELQCFTMMKQGGPPTSDEVEHPGTVFERCDQLIHERFPEAGPTTSRLAIENGSVRTAVLTDGPTTYLCHLGSGIEEISTGKEVQTAGRHVWAGGPLRPETTDVSLSSWDGDPTHRAVVRDGWWALQGVEDEPIGDNWMAVFYHDGGEGYRVGLSGGDEPCDEDDPSC